MFRKIIFLIVLVCSTCLAGCSSMLKEMVANSFPTYGETVENWPELDADHSRIFLFLPTQTPSLSYCKVTLDGVDYGGMLNGTFMFIDVEKGKHTLFCTKSNKPKLNLDLKGGEIVYINGISPLTVNAKQDIENQLGGLNHAFEEALPYDDQPFTIKRRSKQ